MADPFAALIAQENAPAADPLQQAVEYQSLQNAQLANARGRVGLSDAQIANAQNHIGFLANQITPLLQKGSNITQQDVLNQTNHAIKLSNGAITPEEGQAYVDGMPSDGPGIQKFLQQHLMQLQDANSRISTIAGSPSTIDTGAGIQMGTRNAFDQSYTPQGGPNGTVRRTLSPGEQIGTIGVQTDVNGNPYPVSGAQRSQQLGLGGYGAAPAGTTATGVRRVTLGPGGSIVPNQQAASQVAQGAMQAPALGQAGVGPAQAAMIANSSQKYVADQNAMGDYPVRMSQNQQALTSLQNARTGHNADFINNILATAKAAPGLGAFIPPGESNALTAYDEANKLLTQAAAGGAAARSDAQLQTSLASNPSVHIDKDAAIAIQKAKIAFDRYQAFTYNNFTAHGGQPGQYGNYLSSQSLQNVDPRAFSADLQTPSERAEYVNSLPTAQAKQRYVNGIRAATTGPQPAFSLGQLGIGGNSGQ